MHISEFKNPGFPPGFFSLLHKNVAKFWVISLPVLGFRLPLYCPQIALYGVYGCFRPSDFPLIFAPSERLLWAGKHPIESVCALRNDLGFMPGVQNR